MIKVSQDRQPGLGTTGITGTLTITKTGTTARTATFPDAAITVAGSASALTSGRVPYATTGGLLTDEAGFEYNSTSNVLSCGAINLSAGSGLLLDATGATTGYKLFRVTNDGGSCRFGIDSSAGGQIAVGSSAYSMVIGTNTATSLQLATNNNVRLTIDSAGAVTCTGTVTVPSGTAAAPGIRLTSEAHGLYRASATSLGFAVAGTAMATLTASSVFNIPANINGVAQISVDNASAGATAYAQVRASNDAAKNAYFGVVGSASTPFGGVGASEAYMGCNTTALHIITSDTSRISITSAGIVATSNTTDATTTSDGSVRLSGGLSVVKSLVTGNARKIGVRSVTSAAGTTTLDGTDHCAVCTGSTTQTFTLPAAAAGRILFIKNRSTGNLTVNRAGADTIDGTTTVVLTAGQSLQIVANGTDWVVL